MGQDVQECQKMGWLIWFHAFVRDKYCSAYSGFRVFFGWEYLEVEKQMIDRSQIIRAQHTLSTL